MTQELEVMFERISFCFETRKFADLRILLLDMEPADIALFMEDNLNEKEQLMFTYDTNILEGGSFGAKGCKK